MYHQQNNFQQGGQLASQLPTTLPPFPTGSAPMFDSSYMPNCYPGNNSNSHGYSSMQVQQQYPYNIGVQPLAANVLSSVQQPMMPQNMYAAPSNSWNANPSQQQHQGQPNQQQNQRQDAIINSKVSMVQAYANGYTPPPPNMSSYRGIAAQVASNASGPSSRASSEATSPDGAKRATVRRRRTTNTKPKKKTGKSRSPKTSSTVAKAASSKSSRAAASRSSTIGLSSQSMLRRRSRRAKVGRPVKFCHSLIPLPFSIDFKPINMFAQGSFEVKRPCATVMPITPGAAPEIQPFCHFVNEAWKRAN